MSAGKPANLLQGVIDAIGFGRRSGRKIKNAAFTHAIDPLKSSYSSQVENKASPVGDLIGGAPAGIRNTLTQARDHAREVRQAKQAANALNEASGKKKGDTGFISAPGYLDGLPDAALDRMGSAADYFMGADLTAKGYGNWAYAGGAARAVGAVAAADFFNPFSLGWND
jgi:hypothetical protein